MLLYPSHSSSTVIAEHLANIVHDNEIDEADVVVSPVQNSQLLNLVHTALHIRSELEQIKCQVIMVDGVGSMKIMLTEYP